MLGTDIGRRSVRSLNADQTLNEAWKKDPSWLEWADESSEGRLSFLAQENLQAPLILEITMPSSRVLDL